MGYEISCNICEQTICSKYAGETGRNLYKRGDEHLTDLEKRVAEKPLWKMIRNCGQLKVSERRKCENEEGHGQQNSRFHLGEGFQSSTIFAPGRRSPQYFSLGEKLMSDWVSQSSHT